MSKHISARHHAAVRRIELGRQLIEARRHWPARGPNAKGWGAFLADLGIDQDVALDVMRYARFVDENPNWESPSIPSKRSAGQAESEVPLDAGVYFVQSAGGGPIKIGVSKNVRARIRSLQTSSPTPLVLLGVVAGSRDTEAALHHRLHASRIRGEWFADSDEVRRAIAGTAS